MESKLNFDLKSELIHLKLNQCHLLTYNGDCLDCTLQKQMKKLTLKLNWNQVKFFGECLNVLFQSIAFVKFNLIDSLSAPKTSGVRFSDYNSFNRKRNEKYCLSLLLCNKKKITSAANADKCIIQRKEIKINREFETK